MGAAARRHPSGLASFPDSYKRANMPLFDDREMELWEHLSELRSRIMRVLLYLVVGAVVCWNIYPFLHNLITAPLGPILVQYGIRMAHKTITGPFAMQLQISVIGGLIMALPLLTLELWGFVAPGLTREER